jgi:hypothetical protein
MVDSARRVHEVRVGRYACRATAFEALHWGPFDRCFLGWSGFGRRRFDRGKLRHATRLWIDVDFKVLFRSVRPL